MEDMPAGDDVNGPNSLQPSSQSYGSVDGPNTTVHAGELQTPTEIIQP